MPHCSQTPRQLPSAADNHPPSTLKSSSDSFSSCSSIRNGEPFQVLPRHVPAAKRPAEWTQAQLQALNSAASQSAALRSGQAEAVLLTNSFNSAEKKKQKLAKNRATAALSRERKKAHLDVLQQRVSLLERTNSTLSEQLALRDAEVLHLKSRLGDVTDTQTQQSTQIPVAEEQKVAPPHIVLPAVSALPRIYCSVANPPSSSYPHQPNPPSSSSAPVHGTDAQQQQQPQCKLEESTSCDMQYHPITIKPEVHSLGDQSSQAQHAVITSGHFPVFSSMAVKDTCQPHPLPNTACSLPLQLQHQDMSYVPDHQPQMGICSAKHNVAAYRQDAVGCSEAWQPSAYDMNSYTYQNACNGLGDGHYQGMFAPDKAFNEQELLAWQLMPSEQVQTEAFAAQAKGMHSSVSHSEPQCPDIGEADALARHQSCSSIPGSQDWKATQEGQQRGMQLDVAAGHVSSWLPTSLEEGMEGPGTDPTAHLFEELEQLEPHALGCTKPRSIVCVV